MILTVGDQTITVKLSEEKMREVTLQYIFEYARACDYCPVRNFCEDDEQSNRDITCEDTILEFILGKHNWKVVKEAEE